MDIYLFQLDSVRNSPEEIRAGQEALMEQMLVYGNTVVLTLNQLVDSMAFLQAIHDEKKAHVIRELIRLGKIRVSSFFYANQKARRRKYISASNYFQSAMERIESDEKNSSGKYHFSCCFIDEKDPVQVQIALSAIRYSNPNIIDDETTVIEAGGRSDIVLQAGNSSEELFDYSGWDQEKRDREIRSLQDMKRYVEIILLLSRNDNKVVPPREDIPADHKLLGYFRRILNIYVNESETSMTRPEQTLKSSLNSSQIGMLVQAINLLDEGSKEIKSLPPNPDQRVDLDKRSSWYHLIEIKREEMLKIGSSDAEQLAEYMQMIIDLCYNFTCEYSISSITLAYSDNSDAGFQAEFEKQMKHCIDLSEQHIFSWNEKKVEISFIHTTSEEQDDWSNMLSIIQMNQKLENEQKKDDFQERKKSDSSLDDCAGQPYIAKMQFQKNYWASLTNSGIRRERFSAVGYLFVFVIFQYLSNELQDLYNFGAGHLSEYFPDIPKVLADLIIMVVMIVLLGFITSLISQKLKLPDILDSIALSRDSRHKRRLLKKAETQSI